MTRMIDRRSLCAAGATLTLVLLAQQARADEAAIKIDNFTFIPDTITVKPGTVVTWTNEDDIPHSILGVGGNIHSKAFDTNETFGFTFSEPGTYNHFCGLHPHMKGKIIVAP